MYDFQSFIDACETAAAQPDAQVKVRTIIEEWLHHPDEIATVLKDYGDVSSLDTMVFHSSERLTLIHVTLDPLFIAGPHNHGMWAVVGVYGGREDNTFYKVDDGRLSVATHKSVNAPETLTLGKNIIHAIRNPLDVQLKAIHAYGGDLMRAERSTWDPTTSVETPYDWKKISGPGNK